jgi:3-oxoadipate enol-lactonase
VIVQSNGIRLNVAVDGPQDGPVVTFIGGITNDHGLWAAQVPALSPTYRVLRLDPRGHGLSDTSPAPYNLEQLAGDVVGAWDAFGVTRACVGGLGLGGVVAAEIAWRYPARVSGLVPVSCRTSVTPQYRSIWPPMIEKASAGGMAAIAQPTLERWFSEEFRAANPALMDSIRAAILATSLQGYLGSIAALLTLDWGARLKDFRIPVMYVSGENDRVGAPPEVMQAMCEATPGSSHVVLAGATHISAVCNARDFNAAMGKFLAAL